MKSHTIFTWMTTYARNFTPRVVAPRVIALCLLVVGVLAATSFANTAALNTRGAMPAAPDMETAEAGIAVYPALVNAPASLPPTKVTLDEEGYTLWTTDWGSLPYRWCVPYSRIVYPFDLTWYDPTALSDTSFILTYKQGDEATIYGDSIDDPTWTVSLNGQPPHEYHAIGTISGPVIPDELWRGTGYSSAIIPFDPQVNRLIDGVNNIWLKQHDYCYNPHLHDQACTCVELRVVQLRARVALGVREVSPENGARNVRVTQASAPDARDLHAALVSPTELRIRFTAPVSSSTVNEHTFQLYYRDPNQQRVVVPGEVRRISPVEYVFAPDAPLKDGIRYGAVVWGRANALRAGHSHWVEDQLGEPLERGMQWSFWTMPEIEPRLVPVQVLHDQPLIAYKPTALRVFMDYINVHLDVYWRDRWEYVDVEDIEITWRASSGAHAGSASWRAGGPAWHFAYTPETARRYWLTDKFQRMASGDSINYYGFVPQEPGGYTLRATITVLDNHNEPHHFPVEVTPNVITARWLNLHARALAVGDAYGNTGVMDLGSTHLGSRSGIQAIYPVQNVRLAQPASAIPYYAPVGAMVWSSAPAGDMQLLKALLEMNALCAGTSGCDLMVGYVPMAWLRDIGLTSPRQAWYGMLVQENYVDHFRYIVAHEGGHLYGFEHDEPLSGGEGYDVMRRADRRFFTAWMEPQTHRTLNVIHSFMTVDPVESPPVERLWIESGKYNSLRNRFTTASQAVLHTTSSEPLLLVSGILTPTTGDVSLAPWYQLEPGAWETPPDGPYRLVFLDGAGAEIAGYTRPFTVATHLQPAGGGDRTLPPDAPAPFALKVPYPPAMARIQIRRDGDDALLAERVLSASAPTISITPPASQTWSGPQSIAWETDPGETRHFIVQVSTDNGATWEAQTVNWPGTVYTLETASMVNTTEALVRVLATDGLNTAAAVAGPFTIDNPLGVDYVSPTPGEEYVNVAQPLYAGFREAMDPTTIHSGTFTLSGGPYGSVPGYVLYDAETREATFIPKTQLAYSTTYTAHVNPAIRTLAGTALAEGATWSFTTEPDYHPPRPRLLSPPHAAFNVPRTTAIAVLWDRALDAGTVTPATFQVTELHGAAIAGSLAYDAGAQMTTFTPDALLAPDTTYVVTLTAGISDTLGNATFAPVVWDFTTGETTPTIAFSGAYADWGIDTNGDGLYEYLGIQVGVHIPFSATYVLQGILVDATGAEISWTQSSVDLQEGAHFIPLYFDGAAIGGRGVDGPYTLTRLTLSTDDAPVIWAMDAHRTFAYAASHFPAPLRFSGLPNLLLRPGTRLLPAFNARDYAWHATQPSEALTYTLLANTALHAGVTIDAAGNVYVNPEPAYGDIPWTGSALVTLQAAYGPHRVQNTFRVTVGWSTHLYLPVTLRDFDSSRAQAARTHWQIAFTDDFEQAPLLWQRWSSYSAFPPRSYQWDRRDCAAHSGQYSAWAFGGGEDGAALACGASYPQTLVSTMLRGPFNLRYTSQAEFRMKVWTNLAPGDEVCALVTNQDLGPNDMWQAQYHGVCRSGQTAGWEDLVLDLSNAPVFGNLLEQEKVWVAVQFRAQGGDSRPVGVYVDDVVLRLCPLGTSCETDIPTGQPGVTPDPLAGVIGGYDADVEDVALAREASGRLHALWTGRLNPHFAPFAYYATSADGVNWTPFQILNYAPAYEPQIAVDDARQRVHLMYRADGIVHHVVENGVVAPPLIVDNTLESSPLGMLSGPGRPRLTVAPGTGDVHVVWRQARFVYISPTTLAGRMRTWYAYWDGANWSARQQVINDDDTWDATLAADDQGGVMLAWFQRWEQSQGGPLDAGEPTVPRTAYGLATRPGHFPLRQGVSAVYPEPETDRSIRLAYSAGDGAYVLVAEHRMWPGHSRVYRYRWENEVWSAFLDVAENLSGWGVPVYVGAAADSPLIRYVYSNNGVLTLRTETAGVLDAPQTVAAYLSTRGYAGAPSAYFVDRTGALHIALTGEKAGTPGFYYVQP